MGKFKKGLFLGGLLGAGLMWLSTTQKGRETKEKILDYAADIYVKMKEEVLKSQTYQDLNKNSYVLLVKDYVNKYAIENGLAENVKNMIIKILSSQWNNLRDELKK